MIKISIKHDCAVCTALQLIEILFAVKYDIKFNMKLPHCPLNDNHHMNMQEVLTFHFK